ncbi:MAG: pentapeptide repeat-containing protein [bacterium]
MKKNFVLITFFLCNLLSNSKAYSLFKDYSSNKELLEKKIYTRNSDDLSYIRACSKDFSHEDLSQETFNRILFKDSNFKYTNFENTFIAHCDFKRANLKNANFTNAKLFNIENLEKVISVKNANFQSAKFLTNEQKKFLRENGALNVPRNQTIKELQSEIAEEQCNDCMGCLLVTALSIGGLALLFHNI